MFAHMEYELANIMGWFHGNIITESKGVIWEWSQYF